MAAVAELSAAELAAGWEYLRALRKLKFEPDVLCWIVENEFDGIGSDPNFHNRLAIVTTLVDRTGPQKLYELLFEAYTLSVLPKEIDPFNVSVFSPQSRDGRFIVDTAEPKSVRRMRRQTGGGDGPMWGMIANLGHINSAPWSNGIYVYNVRNRGENVDIRRFEVMRRTLGELAA